MRIFTFGRVVKLGLLGAGIYYVRTHGGVRAVWGKLVDEAKATIGPLEHVAQNAAEEVKDTIGKAHPASMPAMSDSDYERAPSSPYGNEPGGSFPSDKNRFKG